MSVNFLSLHLTVSGCQGYFILYSTEHKYFFLHRYDVDSTCHNQRIIAVVARFLHYFEMGIGLHEI